MSACDHLQRRIAALFAEHLQIEVPSPETDLIGEGILDSLKFVELLVQLEQTFGIRISLDELELDQFRSVRRIAEFVGQQAQ